MRRAATAPRVTVIIPTWNWSSVLPYSVGSVLAQTWRDFELLVIGDGCTDDSGEVVARAAAGDTRVRWINLAENFGQQAWPNNEGLRQARGELIAYLGHDDLMLPDHLANLVQAIEAGADLAYAPVASVETDGSVRRSAPPYVPGLWLPPTGVMHRKRLTDHAGGWRDWRELSQDPETELWQRLHATGARFIDTGRVSAIKLPAAKRHKVYLTKPCHEQAAWAARIAREPDLGTALTARLTAPGAPISYDPPSPRQANWRGKLWVLLPWRLRKWIRYWIFGQRQILIREPGESYGDYFKRRLRFKGAEASGSEREAR